MRANYSQVTDLVDVLRHDGVQCGVALQVLAQRHVLEQRVGLRAVTHGAERFRQARANIVTRHRDLSRDRKK